MIKNFNNSIFLTSYSYSSNRAMIRNASDAFSRTFCNKRNALIYGANKTQGRCLFCGKKMYSEKNGVATFSNTVHFDHLYPASKTGLFTRGNVAITCESCNLSKSDRDPVDYYEMRQAEELPLLKYDKKEFLKFLKDFVSPYKKKWPKHYKLATVKEIDDDEFKKKLIELFIDPIELSRNATKYNHTSSVNWKTWTKVIGKAYDTYTPLTAKDVEGRIGFANSLFEEKFGSDSLLSDLTLRQLKEYFNEMLVVKYESKNEVQKYRMLIKMTIQVLNEEIFDGTLDGLYAQVPTYAKIQNS